MEQLVSRLGTLQQAGQAALNTAQRRLGQIAKEKEVWVQKEASGLISSEIVNNKLQALTEEEQTLQAKLSNRPEASKHTAWTLTRAINLLSRLPELFAGSQPEQKRKILNLIFANLSLKDKKLEIIYKKPFNLLAEGSKCCIWGANQLPVPHFYPNPVKKIAFSLCQTGNISLYPKERLYLFCIRIPR